MSDIALIAADSISFTLGYELSVRLFPEILVVRGLLGEGVAAAANQIRQGTEIIISRGATAKAIKEAFPMLTHVTIQRSAFDYISALNLARSIGNPIVAIALPHLVDGLTAAARAMNLHIRLYPIFKSEEVEPAILRAVSEGASVVIGSSSTGIAATRLKVPHVVVQSGEESIIAAMTEAQRIYEVMRTDKAERVLLHAVADAADSGIIALDTAGKVVAFNATAERMTGVHINSVLGKSCSELWPEFDFKRAIKSDSTAFDFSLAGNPDIVATSRLVKNHEKTAGIIISFRDMERLRILASATRKCIGAGHIARAHFKDIQGASPSIQRTIALAKQYAQTDHTVLIVGETGTGKELVAQSLHNHSARAGCPFVAVNCAALPGSLLESELFGYVSGAFTGASSKGKPGLFEQAYGGTIFLDEITEIEPHIQTKLLRVIQEKEVMRLGSDTITPFDVRIIAASNKDIPPLLDSGKFRADLYYRLNVLMLNLPPLRERQEDIPRLCRYFLKLHTSQTIPVPSFTPGALRQLCAWPWRGNIREMQNVMTRIAATIKGHQVEENTVRSLLEGTTLLSIANNFSQEEETIRKALAESGGNKTKAAASLGMSRTTFWRKMREIDQSLLDV